MEQIPSKVCRTEQFHIYPIKIEDLYFDKVTIGISLQFRVMLAKSGFLQTDIRNRRDFQINLSRLVMAVFPWYYYLCRGRYFQILQCARPKSIYNRFYSLDI